VARSYVHEARKRIGPKKGRIRPIIARLKAAHPDAKIALRYPNELELLVRGAPEPRRLGYRVDQLTSSTG
jgi:hypothetical protein